MERVSVVYQNSFSTMQMTVRVLKTLKTLKMFYQELQQLLRSLLTITASSCTWRKVFKELNSAKYIYIYIFIYTHI